MGNITASLAILVSLAALGLQVYQMKKVRVPLLPWGQVLLWLAGIALAISSFFLNVHLLLIVPVSLALAANILFFAVLFMSKLPAAAPAVEVGQRYIDFTATDSHGNPFTLSSMEGKPVLLKFFRGHWCLYCHNEIAAFDKFYDAYKELGIEMVVVSADTQEEARKMKEKLGLKATVISDENLTVIDKYRVRHDDALTGARKAIRPIAIPTSVLISADGIVRWIDVSENYRVRLDPMTVLVKSKTTLKKCEVTNKTKLVRAQNDFLDNGDQQQHNAEHGDD